MAHGLVLKLEEMLQQKKIDVTGNVKEPVKPYESLDIYSDISIIKSWIMAANHPRSSKMEFFNLLRKTLLCIFSPKWSKVTRKQDLLRVLSLYFNKFPVITKDYAEVFKAVCKAASEPWRNSFFLWDDLFESNLTIEDTEVQDYFLSEPEEIVLARVHSLVIRRNEKGAMMLAKTSFLYHSRISKDLMLSSRNKT
ncbi:hypothetical protein X975_07623, partial [Stegodyphus mimosarum]